MPSFAPRDEVVPTHFSAKMRSFPALIEVYLLLVDKVMREHGFDLSKGEFLVEQATLATEGCKGDSTMMPNPWPSENAALIPLAAA